MIEKTLPEGNERLILGIDPGFGRMGYAVVAASGNELHLLVCDATITPTGEAYPQRLQLIYEELSVIITRYHPQEAAIEKLFFGKAQCSVCHPAPYYTDNTMHDLQVEHFYKPQTINGMVATTQGPIKTFPLRGIKESPPYFHDGRLLTLEDTVEFFNLVLELKLSRQEKKDLVAFLRQL